MNRPPFSSTENPFAASRLKPGTIDFLFVDAAESSARLVDRWWSLRAAQVVGPHGSGKSTLLSAIERELDRRGIAWSRITLRDRQRRLPADWAASLPEARGGCLLVDGYEQLSFFEQARLRWRCWRQGRRLLVTSHRRAWLPVLYETRSEPELAARVVGALAPGEEVVSREELARRLREHGGDLRETLFSLYDDVEARRRLTADAREQSAD